jgi:hypothetical protein
MPKFNVTLTRHLEQSAVVTITARNADAAQAKVEDLISTKTWEVITKDARKIIDDSYDIDIDDVAEA